MLQKLIHNEILKNTSYTLLGKVVAMLLYMALDISCARILTPEDYAEWVFFYAVLTMMFYIGWCGINTSSKVFVSKEFTKEGVNKIIRASFLLRLIISIVISMFFVVVAFPLAKWLGYPDKYSGLFRLFIFAGLLVFFNSCSEFFKEMFMGLGDFKKLCVITILEFSGYFSFSIVFLTSIKKAEAIALGYVCSGIVVFFFGTACLRRITQTGLLSKKAFKNRNIMKGIFKYALPIAMSSIGGIILIEMDTFMLGILSTKSQVANYGIAKNLCTKATHVNYALTVGSMTSFSVITGENIKEKCLKFKRTNWINILISLSVAGVFLLTGTFVITILYGVDYIEAGKILKYLVPYYMMYAVSSFFATFLDFQGKAKTRSICYCSVVLINLILNLLFIPQFGAVGAAMATSISLIPYTALVVIITGRVIGNYKHNLD